MKIYMVSLLHRATINDVYTVSRVKGGSRQIIVCSEYEERNKDNVPEPYVPPPETARNRLAELLSEDEDDVADDGGADGQSSGDHQAMNGEHTTSVVEAEVYAAVDHDADLPPPPPPDFDLATDQVTDHCDTA